MNFLDEVKITVISGKGGNGCVSFRREKFVSHGGPDGGNGGKGGDVIFVSNSNLNTLADFRHKRIFKAEHGENGKGSNRTGKSAENIYIQIPVGTQIYDSTGQLLLYDFKTEDDSFIAVKGGKGGLGNINFKSSVNQAPQIAISGETYEEATIHLKLKLLSDVGLIGMPNAGKSSFLSQVTAAKPKIADYPFTTIIPNLGVVSIDYDEFVIADIPGLIEGAHTGYGLGDKFLKHIERCNILIHMIDISDDNFLDNYKIIRNELSSYSTKLSEKTEIICLNKCDLVEEDIQNERKSIIEGIINNKVFLISTFSRKNLDILLRYILKVLKK